MKPITLEDIKEIHEELKESPPPRMPIYIIPDDLFYYGYLNSAPRIHSAITNHINITKVNKYTYRGVKYIKSSYTLKDYQCT